MNKKITLSIIVISHNQCEKLKRCIDSILSQDIPFSYEIIISDDASNDGSWELIQDYTIKYPIIKAVQCNTDDFNPAIRSERSGWNRCNGYKYAKGKYIAHVDGDDFFVNSSDIYKKQVDLLEQHPECSCCMANDYTLRDGDDIAKKEIKHKEHFDTGQILSSEIYIRKYFRESHCFVYRRNCDVDPVKLYGGYYVDTLITDHHIQFGNIVCLDDAGYVYVQYKTSIWAETVKSNDSKVFAHAIYIPVLIPKWTNVFYTELRHLSMILAVVQLARSSHQLKEDNLRWISRFDIFLYHAFNRKLGTTDRLHLSFLFYYIRILMKFKLYNKISSILLKYML